MVDVKLLTMNTLSSNLTQYTVVKGGVVGVFGTNWSGYNWSALATDYILSQLIFSARYAKVLCLNLDRQDLDKFTLKDILDDGNNLDTNVTSGGKDKDNHPKLCMVNALNSLTYTRNKKETIATLEELYQTLKNRLEEAIIPADSPNVNNKAVGEVLVGPYSSSQNLAVVINSISELILNVGLNTTKSFLLRVVQLMNLMSARNKLSAPPCILLGVYESLHSSIDIAHIQRMMTDLANAVSLPSPPTLTQPSTLSSSSSSSSSSLPTPSPALPATVTPAATVAPAAPSLVKGVGCVFVRCLPNRGTLSPEVSAEFHLIRKTAASSTGKITECVEMFGCQQGKLQPMLSVAQQQQQKRLVKQIVSGAQETAVIGAAGGEEDHVSTVTSSTAATNATTTTTNTTSTDIISRAFASSSGNSHTSSSEISSSSSSSSATGPVGTTGSKRLITFDSTDPEFDDDSDPDADLDL